MQWWRCAYKPSNCTIYHNSKGFEKLHIAKLKVKLVDIQFRGVVVQPIMWCNSRCWVPILMHPANNNFPFCDHFYHQYTTSIWLPPGQRKQNIYRLRTTTPAFLLSFGESHHAAVRVQSSWEGTWNSRKIGKRDRITKQLKEKNNELMDEPVSKKQDWEMNHRNSILCVQHRKNRREKVRIPISISSIDNQYEREKERKYYLKWNKIAISRVRNNLNSKYAYQDSILDLF